ncbi:MAG: hypothetical protein Q7S33_04470 [Nanoarchaeota archaeon]|nr:hypothetical protein [Nanoarchaeota archaeon]
MNNKLFFLGLIILLMSFTLEIFTSLGYNNVNQAIWLIIALVGLGIAIAGVEQGKSARARKVGKRKKKRI